MTSPYARSSSDTIADIAITSDTVVLQNRRLYRESAERLSQFGDPTWDLFPANHSRHYSQQSIKWTGYPEPFRYGLKLYVFALLNVIENAPRLSWARTEVPSIPTIWADLVHLRAFMKWLVEENVHSFADVTEQVLDRYYASVIDEPSTSMNRRKRLLAVARFFVYRDVLPTHCHFSVTTLWGGATPAELAGDKPHRSRENRTPRINPDVMQSLLSAALLVVDMIAADVLPVAKTLTQMRAAAVASSTPSRRASSRTTPRWQTTPGQMTAALASFADAGYSLPGVFGEEDAVPVLDLQALAHATWVDLAVLERGVAADILRDCNLPIEPNLLRINTFSSSSKNGPPWRSSPVDTAETITLMRYITTACYIVVAYLSGLRTGEVLNLQRGCVTYDRDLNLIFLSGRQLKAHYSRTERSPDTTPWVINEAGAQAITVLEELAPAETLFPSGRWGSVQWQSSDRTRVIGRINRDIKEFIDWFNSDVAAATSSPVIGEDNQGPITSMRFRRTLAWHIVRRPGGTIAGATQYGHLHSQMTLGYAGQADAGFKDEITFEQFLLRIEQLYDDHQHLTEGEHVSGPSAGQYEERITKGLQRFEGLTVTTNAQAKTALTNPSLNIFHGKLVTCVFRPDTALCQSAAAEDSNPSFPHCRSSCSNIAYTDRDMTKLTGQLTILQQDLAAPGLPEPLKRRIGEHVLAIEQAIQRHEATRHGEEDHDEPA